MNLVHALRIFAAIGVTAATMAGTALAQPAGGTNDPRLADDQLVDSTLGVLAPRSTPRLLLRPPADPFEFRGPLPFDQEPPAGQADFSDDATEPVNPRGGKGSL